MNSRGAALMVCICWAILVATTSFAQTTAPATTQASAEIRLQVTTEQGEKEIQATVTSAGKPVEGATVAFFVKRHFGRLPIGKDQTLDDGTAAVKFPANLPGGATGELQVMATVQAPSQYTQATAQATFGGAAVVQASEDEFPRALWAPRAPWLLLITLVGIIAVVWCVYAYVVAQIWAIYKAR